MKKNNFICLLSLCMGHQLYAQQPVQPSATDSLHKIEQLDEVTVIENSRKIKNDTLSRSLKMEVPLIAIPQNIQSVSATLLKEQGGFELRDAARNSSGIYFGLHNNVFDGTSNLFIRGFAQNGLFRNGLPNDYGMSQDDETTIERVEFIKGPAGFLGSAGEAGGRMNVVTKTPLNQWVFNLTRTEGSYHYQRTSLDLGSPVKNKGFSYRFNAAYNAQDYFVGIMKSNKLVLAPVIQYNLGKRTYFLAEYTLNDQHAKYGSTFTKLFPEDQLLTDDKHANYQADFGLPTSVSKSQQARLVFTHAFNDHWKITSQSAYVHSPATVWSFLAEETGWNAVGFDENGISHRLSYMSDGKSAVKSTQLFVNGEFKTGSLFTHHLVVGGEYYTTKDSTYQTYSLKSFLFDIHNLQYGINRDSLTADQQAFNGFSHHNKLAAAYLYNTVYVGKHLVVTLGGRFTHSKKDDNGQYASQVSLFTQNAFSPRAGLTYLIDDHTAAYFLYDQSFLPTSGQDKEGNSFKPIRGEDREIGLKRDWYGGQLSTSVTVFDIARNNMVTLDPEDTKFSKQLGQVRSKGIEVDVLGKISRSFSVSANYAYSKAKITKDDDPEVIGNLYTSSPKEVVNTWLRYAFPRNFLPGLSMALGQTSIVKKATTTVGTFLPDYTKLDGSVAYTRGKITTRLLLDNLTNKRYLQTGDIYGGNGYYTEGMPFNFKLSLGVAL